MGRLGSVNDDPQDVFSFLDELVCCLLLIVVFSAAVLQDVEVFQRYLTFCGIGIQNAQLFEMSVLEFRRNQILLNLARSIFEEQNNLECLVTKIMTEARELLKCERCAVFLLDTECCEADTECCEAVMNILCYFSCAVFLLDTECCEAWRVVTVAVTRNAVHRPSLFNAKLPFVETDVN
uniref:Uncharacterized protein n=1 Tax=Timema genevievae TaxID=629358 RepID=A0A7R9JW29_TIMGE|nr:unnamed protein product [Timema genevievae]